MMARGGKIDRKYTHFALRGSDQLILTGWDYRGVDKEDISYYAKVDLKDMDVNPSDYKILTKDSLTKIGIDPFDTENWVYGNKNSLMDDGGMMEKGGKIEVGDILILPKDMGITASGIKDKINNNKKIITTKWVVKEIYIDRYGADRIVINNSKEERTSYRDKVQMLNNYFKYGVQFKDGGMMADGGKTNGDDEDVDLFENYDNIPPKVQRVLTKHSEAFEEEDYDKLSKALSDMEKIGYTFEYGLDGVAYNLRKKKR